MTTLTERTDHESRLLPYVMSALTDEASVVQEDAMELMDKLGAQYEREHEKDLKSTMAYMPEHFGGEAAYGAGDDALVLPPPFTTRPRLGSRILVKNNFSAVVNPVIGEMSSWQTELRGKAATLLRPRPWRTSRSERARVCATRFAFRFSSRAGGRLPGGAASATTPGSYAAAFG